VSEWAERREGICEVALGVAVEVPLAGEKRDQRAKMVRVMISLSEREAWGPARFLGGWEWQKSSTVT
jgi:hypothetical protein